MNPVFQRTHQLLIRTRTGGLLFLFGGGIYASIELLYRQQTYLSMFFAGGCSLLLIHRWCNNRRSAHRPLIVRCAIGSAAITVVEFVFGLLFNRSHHVWDYSALPFNLAGQICLPFSLIWGVLSLPAMVLSKWMVQVLAHPTASNRIPLQNA